MTPTTEEKIAIFRKMSLLKQNDERFRSVIKSGRLTMPYYSPRGQEVIPSAISVCLNEDDYICTIYTSPKYFSCFFPPCGQFLF